MFARLSQARLSQARLSQAIAFAALYGLFPACNPPCGEDALACGEGGQHLWVALRIEEAALDYPLVSLALKAEVNDTSDAPTSRTATPGWESPSAPGKPSPSVTVQEHDAVTHARRHESTPSLGR